MDNFEELSNDELRLQLLQYGYQNMPVTQTTRKLYIKKLRNHVNNETDKLRRETVHVTKYSSDEDSEVVPVNNKKETKRRATFGIVPLSKPVATTSTTATITEKSVEEPIKQRKSGRLTPMKKPSNQAPIKGPDYNEEASIMDDSDDEIFLPIILDDIKTAAKQSSTTSRAKSKSKSPTRGKPSQVKPKPENPQPIIEDNNENDVEEEDDDEVILVAEERVPPRIAPRAAEPSIYDKYKHLYLPPRSRTLELNNAGGNSQSTSASKRVSAVLPSSQSSSQYLHSRPSLSTSYNYVTSTDNYRSRYDTNEYSNSPYLSKFVSRLSQVRAEPLDTGIDDDDIDNIDANFPDSDRWDSRGSRHYPRRRVLQTQSSSIFDSFNAVMDGLERKYNLKRNLAIIFILLAILFLIVFYYF